MAPCILKRFVKACWVKFSIQVYNRYKLHESRYIQNERRECNKEKVLRTNYFCRIKSTQICMRKYNKSTKYANLVSSKTG